MIFNLFKIIYINKYYLNMDILIEKIEAKEEITEITLIELLKNLKFEQITRYDSFEIYIILKKYNIDIVSETQDFFYLQKLETIYKFMEQFSLELRVEYLEYNIEEFIKIMKNNIIVKFMCGFDRYYLRIKR